ncbi:MAG: shikimate kinase [Anaerolineae bacterium]|nr:shikimate kinase [Anaerolineae bacterium]
MDNDLTVILIGPMCAGKSTLGALLAERLGLPQYAVDEHRWDFYKEIGYDEAAASKIAKSEDGMLGLLRYWKPFEAHAVERVLATQSNCIIDFGAGHSVYEDPNLFARVQAAFAPYPYVILLLPSPDLDESVAILNARFTELLEREVGIVDPAVLDMNARFTKHPSNHRLAKIVIYTNGKTPQATCDEILEKLQPYNT